MFRFPHCLGDLVKYSGTILIGEAKGWSGDVSFAKSFAAPKT
jgi:hypothetical protein